MAVRLRPAPWRMRYSTSPKPFLVAAAVVAVLVVGGCAAMGVWLSVGPRATASEAAAIKLAERVLPGNFATVDLEYRRELRSGGEVTGYAWRLAPVPAGSPSRTRVPTHFGVLACVRGDEATGAASFSYLRWEPAGCGGGEPRLRRVERTAEQDARSINAVMGRGASPAARSDAVMRVGVGS